MINGSSPLGLTVGQKLLSPEQSSFLRWMKSSIVSSPTLKNDERRMNRRRINAQFLFGAILHQVAGVFNRNRSFSDDMNFASAGSLAETYPAAVVAAILAGKTVFARMLFGASSRLLRDVYFTLQSGNGYKRHD
jgi:hypothetical protein